MFLHASKGFIWEKLIACQKVDVKNPLQSSKQFVTEQTLTSRNSRGATGGGPRT